MARIEKTVFISYRRTDVYTALAVYENLKNQGYDVFFDYRSISSGDFEQIITSNIRARAHFLIVLTPTALDRCNEPGDWLRREIELAIDEKRNIVPLFFKGFRFGGSSTSGVSKWLRLGKPDVMTGKLKDLNRYNGLRVHEDYFEEAMQRVRTEFLNKPLDTVLHPVSTEVQKVVEEEQSAADEAIKQLEGDKELAKKDEKKAGQVVEFEELKNQAIRFELKGEFQEALQIYSKIKKSSLYYPGVDVKIKELNDKLQSKPIKNEVVESAPSIPSSRKSIPSRKFVTLIASLLFLLILYILGGKSVLGDLFAVNPEFTQTPHFTETTIAEPVNTNSPISLETVIPLTPTPTPRIGSTMIGIDSMTLVYVPAGSFQMGTKYGQSDAEPVHRVDLDAFWIDKTEITNIMYAQCVQASICELPRYTSSYTRDSYYGNDQFNDYPVIYVSWDNANKYCEWVGRRLPTEAEWEKAARGIDERNFPWSSVLPSNDHDDYLNYNSIIRDTTKVGNYLKGASPYRALDMAGNVEEWVADWYSLTYYSESPMLNPTGPDLGEYRSIRGGSWRSSVYVVGSNFRYSLPPGTAYNTLGFRCAMSGIP